MQNLRTDLQKSNKTAYAEGTRKNLKIQWEAFLLFCTYFHLVSLPVSTDTLQLFAQFLSRTFKSSESIKNYINGVKSMHLILGFSVDHINKFILNLSLKGIAKLNLHCIKQAEPMTPEILLRIADTLDFSKSYDCVYWCLFLFAFFLFARKSNLVPTSKKDLVNKHCLLRSHVQLFPDYLVVSMFWTKTIQRGERVLQMPLVRIKHSILCHVSAYKKMCKAVPVVEDDLPLFMLSRNKVVTYSLYQSKLRECIEKIGLDPQLFSIHSMRRGAATLAFRAKISADKIQLLGDWHSDAYKRYLAFSLQDTSQVSKTLREYIVQKPSVKFCDT